MSKTKRNTMGPLYPTSRHQISDGLDGVNIRTYLAAQAMAGMLANPSYDANPTDAITTLAFEQADSMIAFLESESE